MLVVDAGNALFVGAGSNPGQKEKDRAAFILATMGKLGTKAMAAGHRDLSAGVGFLTEQAKKANVAVLSANLTVADKPVFPGSTVVEVDGIKVGLIGLSPPGPVPGLQKSFGRPTAAAVREELRKLPADVQLRVVLGATYYGDALTLAGDLKGMVDVILQSGDLHPFQVQPVNHNYIVNSGERGRLLVVLNLKLDGTGDFENLDDAERSKDALARVEGNLKQLAERRKAADTDWARSQLDATIAELSVRRDDLKRVVNKGAAKGARTLKSRVIELDATLGDDAEILKGVHAIEPPGSVAAH